jgi:DNA polymerase III subunit beta
MRFSAMAGDLAAAASAAARGVNPKDKARVPILQNLLIAAAGGAITVVGTDGDRRIAASCDAEVEQLGSITVDSRLARWLAALDPAVMIKAALTDGRLHVRAGRCTARIETLPETDFPVFYGPGAERPGESGCSPFSELTLTPEQRQTLFAVPAPAISDETTRYYLNGLYLHADNDDALTAVATNGHFLIRTAVSVSAVNGILRSSGVIIPASACAAVAKLDGSIRIDHRSIEAKGERQIYSSKLIDATYPDYRRTIPGPLNCFASVNRAHLIGALKRLETLGEDTTGAIRFEWGHGQGYGLRLSPRDRDAGSDDLEAETSGNPITVGLSAKLMASALGSLAGDMVKIEAADPGSPVRLSAPGDDATLAIVMPMRI